MSEEIISYNEKQVGIFIAICNELQQFIDATLINATSKLWHAHPVWFIDGNPIVGYSKEKKGVRLMFWSGADFEEVELEVRGSKFRDASIFINAMEEIDKQSLERWLKKSEVIQWDYKNIVKRKGKLERL